MEIKLGKMEKQRWTKLALSRQFFVKALTYRSAKKKAARLTRQAAKNGRGETGGRAYGET